MFHIMENFIDRYLKKPSKYVKRFHNKKKSKCMRKVFIALKSYNYVRSIIQKKTE